MSSDDNNLNTPGFVTRISGISGCDDAPRETGTGCSTVNTGFMDFSLPGIFALPKNESSRELSYLETLFQGANVPGNIHSTERYTDREANCTSNYKLHRAVTVLKPKSKTEVLR